MENSKIIGDAHEIFIYEEEPNVQFLGLEFQLPYSAVVDERIYVEGFTEDELIFNLKKYVENIENAAFYYADFSYTWPPAPESHGEFWLTELDKDDKEYFIYNFNRENR